MFRNPFLFAFLSAVVALTVAPSQALAQEGAADPAHEAPAALVADPSPAIPAAVAPVEPPAPVPAVAVVQAAADPLAALDVGQLAQMVQSPYGILLVAAGLVYLLLEIAKGLWLSLAAAPPARKRAIALLLGATVGGLLSLAGPVAWWIGLVAGALGAVVPVAGRALGQTLRTPGKGGVSGLVLAAVLGLTVAGGASLYACSAAQVATMRATGGDLAACLLECGVGAASSTIRQAGAGYQIEGEAIGYQALGCALPCLLRAGTVTVATYASPPGRWGGSAGEANVYVHDRIVITVSPRSTP